MVTEQSAAYLRLFQHYKNSVMPRSGGLLDQPNAYMQAMELIEAYQSIA